MTQTAPQPTAPAQQLTWPSFRAAVMDWRDSQSDKGSADNAAFCLIDAARDWWTDAMALNAFTVERLEEYAALSRRVSIAAVRDTIRRDYYTAQGDHENAARFAAYLKHY